MNIGDEFSLSLDSPHKDLIYTCENSQEYPKTSLEKCLHIVMSLEYAKLVFS